MFRLTFVRNVFFGFVAATAAGATSAAPALTAADYARAEKVLDARLGHAIRNGSVAARWIGEESRFWYRRDGAAGAEYMLVDAGRAVREPLFDRERLHAAMAAVEVSPGQHEGLFEIDRVDGRLRMTLKPVEGRIVRCDLERYSCTAEKAEGAPADALPSPDGHSQLFLRGENLWLRSAGGERALSHDGEAYFSYGKLPDSSLVSLPQLRSKGPLPPINVAWSQDGRYVFGERLDERALGVYPYVESVPQDGSFRPVVYSLRMALLGDAAQPRSEAFAVDVAGGGKHVFDLGDGASFDPAAVLAWSEHGSEAYVLVKGKDGRRLSLDALDLGSGKVRRIVDETGPTAVLPNNLLYSAANVRVLPETSEAVWFSEKTGWGHLYLYDLRSGRLKRALTSGDWLVRDVVHVDAKRRRLWFTASGREPGRDVYYRHLYRVSLDGGKPVLLTEENAEHAIDSPMPGPFGGAPEGAAFSPDGRYFIDTYSTVSTPPTTVLRSGEDGRVVMKLEDADVSQVVAAGWQPPERVVAKSADGKTDLYAVIYRPPGFSREGKFPVIDAFYGGPQMMNAPRDYAEAVKTSNPVSRASVAQLGFVVVTIDARGTRGRSKAFADVGYGNFADPQIEDHIAVIRQLAARFGGFDLDRVGVYGHSFGGYTSARAILSHPEFYKVAASSAGPHNYQGFYDGLEDLLGVPDYGGGQRVRPTPQSVPLNFAKMDNAPLAKNLRGHLMLAYGDMDENAVPSVTLQLADALIKANKSFDLVYLPNRTHEFFRNDDYYMRRLWDHFVEHLLGAQPPENYQMGSSAPPH